MDEQSNIQDVTGFIFAAGLGTRLRPLTETVPKALVKVQGKPILEYSLDLMIELGITHVIVNTSYLKEQFRKYAGTYKSKLQVTLSEEDEPLGHSGGLRKALPLIKTKYVFSLNADTIIKISAKEFQEVLSKFDGLDDKRRMLVGTYKSSHRPLHFDRNHNLVGIRDREFSPVKPAYSVDTAGLHLITTECIKLIHPKDGFMGFYGDDDLVERMLLKQDAVTGYEFKSMQRSELTNLQDLEYLNSHSLNL